MSDISCQYVCEEKVGIGVMFTQPAVAATHTWQRGVVPPTIQCTPNNIHTLWKQSHRTL